MATSEAVYIDGTQLHPKTTSGGVDRLLLAQDWGAVKIGGKKTPAPYGIGSQVEIAYFPVGSRRVRLELMSKAASEALAWAEYEAIKDLVRASRAPLTLRRTFSSGAGPTTQDRRLIVRAASHPAMSWLTGGRPQFVGRESQGRIRFPLIFDTTENPFWEENGTPPTSTVALATTTQTVSITNSGDWPIGAKIALSALAGSWTSITITNNTTGPNGESGGSIQWSDTVFANGDTFDWRYTDRNQVTWQSGSSIGNPSVINFVLWPGANSVDVIGVGGSSGTVTFTYLPLYL